MALDRGQLGEAEDYYQQALVTFREVQDRQSEGTVLWQLGRVSAQRQQWNRAAEYYQEGLTLAKTVQDAPNYALMAHDYSELLISRLGRCDEGCVLPQKAIRIHYDLGFSCEDEVRTLAEQLGFSSS